MRSKSILVAQREFLENLRTKTFWIGIFFFPVIVVLSIVIPKWLDSRKDVRKYAVVTSPATEELLVALDKRAAIPDMEKVIRQALTWLRDEDEESDRLPEEFRRLVQALDRGDALEVVLFGNQLTPVVEELRRVSPIPIPNREPSGAAESAAAAENSQDEQREQEERRIQAIAAFFQNIGKLRTPDFQTKLDSPEFTALLPNTASLINSRLDLLEDVRRWWSELPPKEAKKFGSSISKSRYERVPIEATGDAQQTDLNERVTEEELFAYFVIEPPAPADGDELEYRFKYVSKNLTDTDLLDWFQNLATAEIRDRRIEAENIDPEVARKIRQRVEFAKKKLGKEGEEEEVEAEDMVRQWAPVAFVYFLWLAVFSISQMLLTNTVEEKSNRILEVLLSSVSPLQLMTGKIIGIAWTGLTMVASWVVSFVVLVRFLPGLIGTDMPFDLTKIAGDPILLTSFIVYFLLGYLFFAALLVGIGSVCNSIKEANNLMMPVTVTLMLPLFAMVPVSKDPNGTLAVFLSYVPPFTPFVMMNRAAGPPTPTEYVVTTIILVVSIVLVFWAAAKIFRIGILMTGKAPTPLEILRWVRAPIGQVPTREVK